VKKLALALLVGLLDYHPFSKSLLQRSDVE